MLRFLTAGESHGPELTVILEGLPSGISVERSDIDDELDRRRRGEGSGGRMSIEMTASELPGASWQGTPLVRRFR